MFVAGATRIQNHLLGENGSKKCSAQCADDDFKTAIDAIKVKAADKQAEKKRKMAVGQVNSAVHAGQGQMTISPGEQRVAKQPALSFQKSSTDVVDEAIAAFFYACNISGNVIAHVKFKDMVRAIKAAPPGYLPPERHRLYGSLLDSVYEKTKRQLYPLQEAVMRECGTVCSDGWDSVTRDHLINFLFGNASAMFFEGTYELCADDAEDAQLVADLVIQCIRKVGELSIIQFVSDTCSVMKAAWRKLEAEFMWLTCTCCGTHVISLELKDLGKLDPVQVVFGQSSKVLSLFWGKKRWPRKKLREVIASNHQGAQFGLYRAKQTRFAGKFRELARMLRVKSDLQQIVVSADYQSQKFSTRGCDWDEESGERIDADIGEQVKTIVLDESGFWTSVSNILRIALPLIKLLRMLDGNKPVIGKIYHRMFTIGERLESMSSRVPWAADMQRLHASRWEYLHSPMHAAAYALDPEYMTVAKHLDAHCQDGLRLILKRQCLRDVILSRPDASPITFNDPEVISRVAQAEREFSAYQRMEGPFSDAACQQNASIMEPAKWWDMYGRHLPILSSIAPRILAQTAAASCAERNWSVYGQVKTDHRCRMKHATSDRLVYLHEAFHIMQRMQDAGWSADVERWESDSDNSDSDDDGDESALRMLMA